MQGSLGVSVIVPAYRHGTHLRTCLAALEGQTDAGGYEVVVVDNGDNGDLSDLVSRFPHATLTEESAEGSYAARNRGLTVARGELLAFTDADCIPAPDWLARGLERLRQSPACGLVGGRVRFVFRDPDRPSAVEFYNSLTDLRQEIYVTKRHFAATANLFTRRSVVDRVGPFDARRKSGGDREFGHRVFAAGLDVVYSPEACVDHPARASLGAVFQKVARLAGNELNDWPEVRRWRTFWGMLVRTIPTPLTELRAALADPNVKGWKRTAQFVAIRVACRWVRQYELARLLCGGAARR